MERKVEDYRLRDIMKKLNDPNSKYKYYCFGYCRFDPDHNDFFKSTVIRHSSIGFAALTDDQTMKVDDTWTFDFGINKLSDETTQDVEPWINKIWIETLTYTTDVGIAKELCRFLSLGMESMGKYDMDTNTCREYCIRSYKFMEVYCKMRSLPWFGDKAAVEDMQENQYMDDLVRIGRDALLTFTLFLYDDDEEEAAEAISDVYKDFQESKPLFNKFYQEMKQLTWK